MVVVGRPTRIIKNHSITSIQITCDSATHLLQDRQRKLAVKTKLIAFLLLAGASAFAQTRFSIRIGGYGPSYGYAPAPAYNHNGYGYGYTRPRGYAPAYGGAGYWGVDPDREHRREEWRGLRNHHEKELEMYGDSPELRQHQEEERYELRHEQWHERNGDIDAGNGPAHGSAYDGMRRW
jgi:hypothetical protein